MNLKRLTGAFSAEGRARALRRAGDAARDAGRWGEAAEQYRAYLRQMPGDGPIWVQLGHMLAEAGDLAAADEAYEAADRLRPNDADLLLTWGHLKKRREDFGAAVAFYRRSHSLNRNPEALSEMAGLAHLPDASAAFVGRIESWFSRRISGVVFPPEDGSPPAGVEFRVAGRVVGQARIGEARPEGGQEFKGELDVDGERVIASAHRMPGGEALEGSPVLLHPDPAFRPGPPPAWSVRAVTVKPFVMPDQKAGGAGELALFITHSATGAVKPHVAGYVRALVDQGVAVLLIAVTDRPLDLPPALVALCAGVIVRENAGYDFAAWAHVLKLHPEIYGADGLYLVNDSVFGPGDGFAETMARVRASAADLVGLTASHEYGWHVQSYFLALKRRLLHSGAFQDFMGRVGILAGKDEVIRAYEVRFAPAMEQAGHPAAVLFPDVVPLNPTLFDWRRLIEQGFPFIKLLMLRGQFPEVDTKGWKTALAAAGFDVPLLKATLAAAQVVPDGGDRALTARPVAPVLDGPPKVALFGPWNYDNGLGSASRGIIGALRRSGARLNLHPVKHPFHIHRRLSPPVDITDFTGAPDVAVVHMNPDSWHLLTDEQKAVIRSARTRIGYWVWEMEHIPVAWWHDWGSVDRIWAPSGYCADLFAREGDTPVDVIPHAVPLPPAPAPGERAAVLAELGLERQARTILYVFDGSSYLVRKNPAALVRAFAASGLAARGWTLVLKTKNLMERAEEGAAFAALAEGTAGVRLIDRSMDAGALARLLAAADIYASPHSSEGFGLTIAEAMAAGKPVVATDYSGSREFLDASCGFPVKAETYALAEDFGHYTKGGVWARIDEPALAEALKRAADQIEAGDTHVGRAAQARVADHLSFEAVGARIATSLAAALAGPGAIPPAGRLHSAMTVGTPANEAEPGHGVMVVPLDADGRPVKRSALPDTRDDWIAFMPAEAVLAPDFGRIVADAARFRPDVSIFYGDDVAFGVADPLNCVRLKPAFDATLLAAQDYIGAPVIVRGSALAALGGLSRIDGPTALDRMMLEADAAGLSVERITRVLIGHHGDRPVAARDDRRAMLAALPALAGMDIADGRAAGLLSLTRRFGKDAPAVSLLIPTRRSMLPDGSGSYVARLLDGIAAADWPMERLTVIVGDDVSGEPEWAGRAWPFTLRRIETPRGPGEPFNYAAKMNLLWRAATTEQIVFLNDDVRPTGPGWLKALMTHAVDASVAGVGARLLYEDGRLQHAGMAPVMGLVAHVWLGRRRAHGTYLDQALVTRAWSMVTGAVFATRRSLMEAVDGFDELLSLEYNDVDLCLRLRALGGRILCSAEAEMVHAEKASRGEAIPPGADRARFVERWRGWLADDPAWHPGLHRDRFAMMPLDDPSAWYRQG